MSTRTHRIPETQRGKRLDVAIADLDSELSRSQIGALIRSGHVSVADSHGHPAPKIKPGLQLVGGETVVLQLRDEEQPSAAPEAIPLDVRYEDDDLIVVNKPAGLVVHPAPGHPSGTLVNALAAHSETLSSEGGAFRPGIVHRLDKNTTGLMVVARNNAAHRILAEQLAARTLTREYLALVWGHLDPPNGVIDAAVGRNRRDGLTMAIGGRAQRAAVTHYESLETYPFASWVRLRLATGRTHQIRVHLQHVGHPVVGDPDYGGLSAVRGVAPVHRVAARALAETMDRQALHACRVAFDHPRTGEPISVASDPPQDVLAARERARGVG